MQFFFAEEQQQQQQLQAVRSKDTQGVFGRVYIRVYGILGITRVDTRVHLEYIPGITRVHPGYTPGITRVDTYPGTSKVYDIP